MSSTQNFLFLICLKNDKPEYEKEDFFFLSTTFMFSPNNLISIPNPSNYRGHSLDIF